MKKIISIIFAVSTLAAFAVGCKSDERASQTAESKAQVQTQTNENEEAAKAEENSDDKTQEIVKADKTVKKTEKKDVKPGKAELLSHKDAKAFIDKEEYTVVIDVRPEEKYKKEHIEDAVGLPEEMIQESAITMIIPMKEQPLLVYGENKEQSREIAEKLADMGYQTVKYIESMDGWKYSTEKQ